MKSLIQFLAVLLTAFWVVAIALIAVQNARTVSLEFLAFRSVEMPFGFLLAVCIAMGMVATSILQPTLTFPWRATPWQRRDRNR
jgi:uncharacterized integral membrane protein